MKNAATVFGAQKLPWSGDDDDVSSSRALLFLSSSSSSSFGRRLFLCRSVPLCASSFPQFFFSKEELLERERNARAKKSMHVNLEHENEETSACFRSSVEMISFVVSYSCGAFLLRERKTNQRTRKRRRWRSSYVCIYIYNARKWIALLCIVRARVVIVFFVNEGWWSDGTTRKSDGFVLSAPKKKERGA